MTSPEVVTAPNAGEVHSFMKFISDSTLSSLTSTQKGFIVTMRSIDAEATGENLREMVADFFPPASLFCKEICDLPSIWTELRKFLNVRGVVFERHTSHRVIKTIARGLYVDAEDREAAIKMADLISAAGRRIRSDLRNGGEASSSTSTPPPSSNFENHDNVGRLVHNVAMRLRDDEKKFSGELGECWMEYVDEYSQVSRDYGLNPQQKLQFLHNLLSKDAKRFYLERVQPYAQTYQQAVDMINQEYNSIVRQTRVKNYLSLLRMSDFVEKGMEMSAALTKVYKVITKLARQVPASHRGDTHKIGFLSQAVVGYKWAREPLSRIATHGLTFQQLYQELEAALQLEKESRLALARDQVLRKRISPPDDVAGINYAGQGRYARNPKFVRSRDKKRNIKGRNPLDITGCFNCGDRDHMLNECKEPINTTKAAARKLEYYKRKDSMRNAVHHVLADLCSQLDEVSSEEEGKEHDDVKTFLAAVNGTGPTSDESPDELAEDILHLEVGESSDEAAIFVMQSSWTNSVPSAFQGACIDSGAERTVIGINQARIYCSLLNVDLETIVKGARLVFTFGEKRHKGIGFIIVRITISNSFVLSVKAHVVDIDVPFLLGLDILTQASLILDFSDDTFTSKSDGWKQPLVRKYGHIYIEWSVNIYFTQSELRKVHRHFYHPHPGKLYALMRRADPKSNAEGLMTDLEKITMTCDVCQREGDAPHRFRVSIPDGQCVFNHTVAMDLVKLDSKQALHIVDKGTKFNAACFLSGESTRNVWDAFMKIWVSTYVGFPDCIAADQGPQFTSEEWESYLKTAGINSRSSGVESHNAIGPGERYHSYLRRVFNKIGTDDPALGPDLKLQLAVKAVNDTAGPPGLVPTLLVFGVLPRVALIPQQLPDQIQRMKTLDKARKEMSKISTEARLKTAFRTNVPAAADKVYNVGDEVLMYREKPVAKWIGPYVIKERNGKMLTLDSGDRLLRASVDKVKYYHSPKSPTSLEIDADRSTPDASGKRGKELQPSSPLLHDSYGIPLSDEMATEEEKEELDDDMFKVLEEMHENERDRRIISDALDVDYPLNISFIGVHITEVLKPSDPRGKTKSFDLAKKAEILGLKKRNVWKVVPKSDVPSDANVLGGRFVLALKNIGSKERKPKARFVAQGHRDKDKPYMVHDIATLRASSIRLILSVAAIKGFRVFSHDVNQAYLQSKDRMSRRIFILPKKEDLGIIGITEEELLELLKPLYGICDAGDYWGITVTLHVEDDLKMSPSLGDPALYLKVSDGELEGVMGIYVDDNLNAGNQAFELMTAESLKTFDSKPRVYDNFEFFGSMISTIKPGEFLLSQERHAKRLQIAPKGCSFKLFRRYRAMFSWMVLSIPQVACAINRAAQVTEYTMSDDKVSEYNIAVKEVKSLRLKGIKFPCIDQESLVLKMYADAAFATNDDLSSQLGYIIILCDKSGRMHVLGYSSKKSRRVVRSIMAGEVYAFVDGFDRAFVLQKDLDNMLNKSIPLHCFTDSKQLFDAVTKGQQTTEKRLMIDILATREAYKSKDISRIGLVASNNNPADGLSKIRDNGALRQLLSTGHDACPVEQWVVRAETSS